MVILGSALAFSYPIPGARRSVQPTRQGSQSSGLPDQGTFVQQGFGLVQIGKFENSNDTIDSYLNDLSKTTSCSKCTKEIGYCSSHIETAELSAQKMQAVDFLTHENNEAIQNIHYKYKYI